MSGRFIQEEISQSDKTGSLSPKSLALFCMIIPHFNAHGKMIGGTGYVKDLVCPKVRWLTHKIIQQCLSEITRKTNVKWFKNNGLWYIHSLNWTEHQPGLRRLGPDKLPTYSKPLPDHSGTTPEQVPPDIDYDKDKDKDIDGKVAPLSLESLISKHKDNPAYKDLDVETEFHKAKTWYETRKQRLTERKLIGWLNRIDRVVPHPPQLAPQSKPMHPQIKKALDEADKPTDDPVDPEDVKKLVKDLTRIKDL